MKTTARFDQAIQKLYNAFYNNTLNPECCKQCAVGNILDQTEAWKHLSDDHGSLRLNYIGRVHEMMNRKFNGYLPSELLKIEATFLQGCGYQLPLRHYNRATHLPFKETLFNGLCKAIGCLCQLDGIKNVIEYERLFRNDNTYICELNTPHETLTAAPF